MATIQRYIALARRLPNGIRFDRNEFSGAFGDIGTDFPLLVGMVMVAGLDTTSVLVMFGAMQIATGLAYRLPVPVQPLKTMAVLVITQGVAGNILYGGGLAIGLVMLLLSVTGLISVLARIVPKSVVRGIQLGLGLQLAILALGEYVPAEGIPGYTLAAVAFVVTLALLSNRRFPPAPFVILMGVVYALIFNLDLGDLARGVGLGLPQLRAPSLQDVLTGFVVLALPQVPLSLGNSILATRQVVKDLFPGRDMSLRKISLTYALMNLVNPFLGGVPTCHGSGGVAGHYAFGGRTGGSVIIYGAFYLILGLFLSQGLGEVIRLFPKPVLGVILAFEGLFMMRLVQDLMSSRLNLTIALLVGLMAVGLPYGYVIGLVAGTALAHLAQRRWLGLEK